MFCSPLETRKARKRHRCTNCGHMIEAGETYNRWMSVDDSMFTNKMHLECYEALVAGENGYWEYSPYDGEPPERLRNA